MTPSCGSRTSTSRAHHRLGAIAALPWFFGLAPLGVAIALRRAQVTGAWLIGLWGVGFAVGFAANSPLGESVTLHRSPRASDDQVHQVGLRVEADDIRASTTKFDKALTSWK